MLPASLATRWRCRAVLASVLALGCGASSRNEGTPRGGAGGGGNASGAGGRGGGAVGGVTGDGGTGGAGAGSGGQAGLGHDAGAAGDATPGGGGGASGKAGAGGAGAGARGGLGGGAGTAAASGASGTTFVPDCTSEPADHAAACPEPCPIEVDTIIGCNDSEFGHYGLRVGAARETTYLATTSTSLAWLGEIGASTFERLSLPVPDWTDKVLELALSPDGTPNLAMAGKGGVFFATPGVDGLTSELVIAYDDFGKQPLDLMVDDQGVIQMGIAHGGATGSYGWGRRVSPGNWQLDPIWPMQRASGVRFAIAQDGKPVSYWSANGTTAWYDGVARIVDLVGAKFIPVPYQAGGKGPTYAVVSQRDEALVASWLDGDNVERPLPETPLSSPQCKAVIGPSSSDCAEGPCHDTAAGVAPDAYAVDRATDGGFFIAYVRRQLDRDLTFSSGPWQPETGIQCLTTVDRDDSHDELHLVRLAQDGAVTEVLVLPIDDYMGPQSDGSQMVKRGIDLDIQGDVLALGVVTGTGMRVLRLHIDGS